MAMLVREVQEWLASLPADDQVAVDDGGLALVLVGRETENYCDVGGVPEDEDERL